LTAERDDPPESAAPLGTVSASETVPAKSVTTFPEASSTETAAEKFAPAGPLHRHRISLGGARTAPVSGYFVCRSGFFLPAHGRIGRRWMTKEVPR